MFEGENIKLIAKEQIRGKIGKLFLVAFIPLLISFILCLIPIAGALINLFVLSPAFAMATAMIYLKNSENEYFKVGEVFSGFNWFWSAFKVNLLIAIFMLLWSIIPIAIILIVIEYTKNFLPSSFVTLLYLVAMIFIAVRYIPYSMSMYILAENPRQSAREIIKESKEIMKGNKIAYFMMLVSFFGWFLLCIITCYIGFIYVGPYVQATITTFYQQIKRQPDSE